MCQIATFLVSLVNCSTDTGPHIHWPMIRCRHWSVVSLVVQSNDSCGASNRQRFHKCLGQADDLEGLIRVTSRRVSRNTSLSVAGVMQDSVPLFAPPVAIELPGCDRLPLFLSPLHEGEWCSLVSLSCKRESSREAVRSAVHAKTPTLLDALWSTHRKRTLQRPRGRQEMQTRSHLS